MGRRSVLRAAARLAPAALAAGILLPSPAMAAHWATEGDPIYLIHAINPDAEELDFTAICQGPTVKVIYVTPDRAKIAAGTAKDCEVERPCRENVPIQLMVDGKATAATATARPEELYGGHEIDIAVPFKSDLWARMAKGRTLSLRIDGVEGERIPLKGISKPLARFISACRKHRPE